jgi:hypothetical protein
MTLFFIVGSAPRYLDEPLDLHQSVVPALPILHLDLLARFIEAQRHPMLAPASLADRTSECVSTLADRDRLLPTALLSCSVECFP